MKLQLVVAAAVVGTALFHSVPSQACGGGEGAVFEDPGSSLQREIARLESSAASFESSAMMLERDAMRSLARARQLRMSADTAAELQRARFLTEAASMEASAAQSRAQAAQNRERAMQMRARARMLKNQTAQLPKKTA